MSHSPRSSALRDEKQQAEAQEKDERDGRNGYKPEIGYRGALQRQRVPEDERIPLYYAVGDSKPSKRLKMPKQRDRPVAVTTDPEGQKTQYEKREAIKKINR